MSGRRSPWPAGLAIALSLLACLGLGACEAEPEPSAQIDTRLEHHAVAPGVATAEGLAYVQAVADAHRRADRSSAEGEALEILLAAVERTPPPGDGTAELLHYELLARAAELMLGRGDSEQALELLAPRLDTARSLPRDRGAARCLVALGDAAAHTGDLALAMGSYSRALDMLTLLIEEVEP